MSNTYYIKGLGEWKLRYFKYRNYPQIYVSTPRTVFSDDWKKNDFKCKVTIGVKENIFKKAWTKLKLFVKKFFHVHGYRLTYFEGPWESYTCYECGNTKTTNNLYGKSRVYSKKDSIGNNR